MSVSAMRELYVFFFLTWGLCCTAQCVKNEFFKNAGPLVKTNTGSVIGKYIKYYDTDVATFFGIPFAKPPLGEKRFAKADPVDPWEGILVAQEKSLECIQYRAPKFDFLPPGNFSEDCLYLNIWAPKRRCSTDFRKLPVLVWIHGGGFAFGSAAPDIYDGSKLVTHGDVIVASMNYRVGPLGFVNVGNEDAPGNVGLMDQVLALQWIKQNIEFFGGDPESITLFAESAGSWCISLHLISPMSRGLFHRAIMQSGSQFNSYLSESGEDAKVTANSLAVAVGCSNNSVNLDTDASAVIQCLRHKDPLFISETYHYLKTNIFSYPSSGNEFLPKQPILAYESGDIAPVEVLLGAMRDEGSIFLIRLGPEEHFSFDGEPKLNLNDANKAIPVVFEFLPSHLHNEIFNFYFKDLSNEDSDGILNAFQLALGDYLMNCPIMFLAEKLNTAYMYWMSHESSTPSVFPKWTGVHHAAELDYVFGKIFVVGDPLLPRDERFSNSIVKKWTDFARSGYPMTDESKQQWPKFTETESITYELNEGHYKTISYPRKEQCKFWGPIIASTSK